MNMWDFDDDGEVVFDVQALIDSGAAWRLEGSVGRMCYNAIEDGYAVLGVEGHHDYYGNYVPSRYEVQEGTKGSVSYANALRLKRGEEPIDVG